MNDRVTLRLSDDVALVLFALVVRLNEQEATSLVDPGEQRAMWDFEASLEAALPAVLSPDFNSLVAQARARLRNGD